MGSPSSVPSVQHAEQDTQSGFCSSGCPSGSSSGPVHGIWPQQRQDVRPKTCHHDRTKYLYQRVELIHLTSVVSTHQAVVLYTSYKNTTEIDWHVLVPKFAHAELWTTPVSQFPGQIQYFWFHVAPTTLYRKDITSGKNKHNIKVETTLAAKSIRTEHSLNTVVIVLVWQFKTFGQECENGDGSEFKVL